MDKLICPLCSLPLMANAQGIACANRHQFDRAKEGYFNLLPVHHKNSREPGDGKHQLSARRAFLCAGYFLPLLDKLKSIINPASQSLLDIGCGEGYFTRGLGAHCEQADIYGIDISKVGIRLASKIDSRTTYAVASSHLLPFADASMDVILRIYAPSKDPELVRIISPKGRLIIVTPGEQHLIGLRRSIYKEVRPHPEQVAPEGFREIYQSTLGFELNLPPGEQASALLAMTPFAWKMGSEQISALEASGIRDEADFRISAYGLL